MFRTCPDRPWGPPSLLYNGYRVFPEGKERPRRDADPSPPSSAVVKKVKSYTSTPSMGRTAVQSHIACTRVHFTFLPYLNIKCQIFTRDIPCVFRLRDKFRLLFTYVYLKHLFANSLCGKFSISVSLESCESECLICYSTESTYRL
jgi:hypothetical protein